MLLTYQIELVLVELLGWLLLHGAGQTAIRLGNVLNRRDQVRGGDGVNIFVLAISIVWTIPTRMDH